MQALIITNDEPSELGQLTTTSSVVLLPLGNKSVLTKLIETFIDSDISDIIIAHSDTQTDHLKNFIEMNKQVWPSYIHIELCTVPKHSSLPECLHRIQSFITSGYLFVTYSTTVVNSLNLRNLFLTMIRNKTCMVAVFSTLPVKESKLFKSLPRELVITASNGTSLLSYYASSDIKKRTTLPSKIFSHHENVLYRSDLRDCGFYLLTRTAVDHISQMKDVAYRKKSIWEYMWSEPVLGSQGESSSDTEDILENKVNNLYCFYQKPSGISVHEHKDAIICTRIEDPLVYAETNRLVIQNFCQTNYSKKSGDSSSKGLNLIEKDCTIGENVLVRSSYVGPNCTIEANSKILNSVLLSGVVIKENCHIEGCVLGDKVTIEHQSDLKNCSVAALQRVPSETDLESKQLGFTDPDF